MVAEEFFLLGFLFFGEGNSFLGLFRFDFRGHRLMDLNSGLMLGLSCFGL